MDWHYEQHGQSRGPIDEKTLKTLLSDGTINYSTRVWNPTLPDWQALGIALGPEGTPILLRVSDKKPLLWSFTWCWKP